MVRAVDDQWFTPFTGVTRGSAQFTKTVVHAVIHHTLFFCLDQQRRRIITTNPCQNLFTGKNALPYPMIRWATYAQARFIGIKTQVTTIPLPAMGQHVQSKRQCAPAPRPDGVPFTNALMALSPVKDMAHHPVRKTHDDAIHRRGERNGIALVLITL